MQKNPRKQAGQKSSWQGQGKEDKNHRPEKGQVHSHKSSIEEGAERRDNCRWWCSDKEEEKEKEIMAIDDLSGEKEKVAEDQKFHVFMQNSFRQCFSTGPGQRVLGYLLIQAGYFDADLDTLEQLAVLNFVKEHILKNCGLLKIHNVDSYVRKLFEIPVIGEQKNGD